MRLSSEEIPVASQTTSMPGVQDGSTQVSPDGAAPIGKNGTQDIRSLDTAETGRSRAASAREQRYKELLQSEPPAAPPPPPKETTLLDRVVTPIARALGVDRPKSATPPGNPVRGPQAQQPPQRVDGSPQNNPAQGARSESSQQPEEDTDTDITPPTLMGVSFNPPEIHDGEDTILTLLVTDNRSGVRSISGVITSPGGGSSQGFACRREGGEQSFIARISVPKNAAEGFWEIRYLSLSDNANNSVNLTSAQRALPPTSRFRVISSASDTKGPELESLRIDSPAMNAGDTNTIHIGAKDDKSGVHQVNGAFVSPSKLARLGFACKDTDGEWLCSMTPPKCLDCGVWQLEYVQMTDNAGNLSRVGVEVGLVAQARLNIVGDSCDATPPRLETFVLDPLVVSNLEGGTIRVEATVSDDGCGASSLSARAIAPPGIGQGVNFSLEPTNDGRTFVGTIPIAKFAAKGEWTIAWVQAFDRGQNTRPIPSSDPVIQQVRFRVE